ncbi:MAG: lactonase family protein [Verrucomicrobiaceae bacterium]|nr:MAG: lactonase family protein [Verrucomicrobiaceae bacterium]
MSFSPRHSPDFSRRALLKYTSALAVGVSLPVGILAPGATGAAEPGTEPDVEKPGPGPLMAYVGTFSSPLRDVKATQVDLPPGNGRGIHLFRMERDTGVLTACGVYEQGTSPSCLVINAGGTRLYSANETDHEAEGGGSVSAFAINRRDGQLKLLNTVSSGGKGPTYVSLHASGQWLFVANYFGGSVAVIPILEDGSLGEVTDLKKPGGTLGPKTATNAPSGSFALSGHDQTHAHMIHVDPAGRFVLSVELGLDQILSWKFDDSAGVLAPNDLHHITPLPPGDGPRHFAFHPKSSWLYSLQEEASTVTLFDYGATSGKLSARQTISSLPPGFAGSSFGSEILISSDGKFLYAGNRLHDSIAVFAIGADGTLTWLAEEWTQGNYPRSFSFDPSGKFLYCCNQRGDNVTTFRVDPVTGLLKFTGYYTPVGNPSIIVFLNLDQPPA